MNNAWLNHSILQYYIKKNFIVTLKVIFQILQTVCAEQCLGQVLQFGWPMWESLKAY